MTKRKCKKAKKRLLIFFSVVIVLAVIIAGLNLISVQNLLKKGSSYNEIEFENQLIPQKDENGYWYFTTDGDFKVMHLTDIHIGGGFMSKSVDEKALNAVATMITREKPDLVVATGDIAFPVPYTAGTFNNYTGAKAFGNLMESLGVYWTVTFGNHDAECYSYFDRESVAEIYSDEDFKHCLFQAGPEDVDGYGNHIIEVKNSKGIITQAMVLIDSQAYVKNNLIDSINGTYDNIHPNQVEWYEAEINRMNAENKAISKKADTVVTHAFFHIPLVEMLDGWKEFTENDFKDTENFRWVKAVNSFTSGSAKISFLKKCWSLVQQRLCITATTISIAQPLNIKEFFSATATALTILHIRVLINWVLKEAAQCLPASPTANFQSTNTTFIRTDITLTASLVKM